MAAREKLLKTAMEVFAEKGFRGASTREIALRAKVNQVTLFRIFGGKEQLYTAAVDQMFQTEPMREQLEEVCAGPLRGVDFLAAVIKVYLDTMMARPQRYRIVLYGALERNPAVMSVIDQYFAPIRTILQKRIQEGIREGEFRRGNSVLMHRLIVAAVVHEYQMAEMYDRPLRGVRMKDIPRKFAELIYNGLRNGTDESEKTD